MHCFKELKLAESRVALRIQEEAGSTGEGLVMLCELVEMFRVVVVSANRPKVLYVYIMEVADADLTPVAEVDSALVAVVRALGTHVGGFLPIIALLLFLGLYVGIYLRLYGLFR